MSMKRRKTRGKMIMKKEKQTKTMRSLRSRLGRMSSMRRTCPHSVGERHLYP
jgi:hypothetical protein